MPGPADLWNPGRHGKFRGEQQGRFRVERALRRGPAGPLPQVPRPPPGAAIAGGRWGAAGRAAAPLHVPEGGYLKPPVIAKKPLILSFVSRSRAAMVRTNVQSRS